MNSKKILFITFISSVIFLLGCFNSKTLVERNKKYAISKMEQITCNKYHDKFEIKYNDIGDYALVYHKNKEFSKPFPDLKYFVYSLNKKNIVIEDSLKAGNIYWNGSYSIFASEREQRAESGTKSYIYDLKHSTYEVN
ncbi:MAG: hypothetical protein R2771_08820 [Saprospiraceae bacterium]